MKYILSIGMLLASPCFAQEKNIDNYNVSIATEDIRFSTQLTNNVKKYTFDMDKTKNIKVIIKSNLENGYYITTEQLTEQNINTSRYIYDFYVKYTIKDNVLTYRVAQAKFSEVCNIKKVCNYANTKEDRFSSQIEIRGTLDLKNITEKKIILKMVDNKEVQLDVLKN